MTDDSGQSVSCLCGHVTLDIAGAPILSAICYCESCRTAARQFEQAPGAPSVRTPDDGVAYCLFRKDRVGISRGAEYLQERRLKVGSPTRRVIASCCNAPMFLDFTSGHWLNLYRDRLPNPPPLEMAVMARDRPDGPPRPGGLPIYAARPAKFMIRLLASWAAMGFRRPKLVW